MKTPAGSDASLDYHVRELRADLAAAQRTLDRARAAPDASHSLVRAWLELMALLEHDLEVHVPGAIARLGPEPAPSDARADTGPVDTTAAATDLTARLLEAARTVAMRDPITQDALRETAVLLSEARTIAGRLHQRAFQAANPT
jgi:hypothetical protein